MKSKRKTVGDIGHELSFKTSRSGGPGGQHVNKVETRIQVIFNVFQSKILTEQEKAILQTKYPSKLTNEGVLIVEADSNRSQLKNKELALAKLDRLLARAFETKKPRKPTQPSKGAIQSRLTSKKIHGDKKANRRRPDY